MTTRLARVARGIFLGAAVIGCTTEAATAPRPFLSVTAAGLELTASMSKAVIARGDTATFHYVLRNSTDRTVVLNFPSGCQLLPYIRSGTDIVYPGGGAWGCTLSITRLTLEPGTMIDRTEIVFAGSIVPANVTWVPLAPGDYAAYAELGHTPRVLGRSTAASFRVH